MNTNQTVVVPTNGVDGNITSCKIETQQLAVHRNSALSLTEITDYASYDVCSKHIIQQYSIQGFTGLSVFAGFVCALMILAIISMFSSSSSY